MLIIDKILKKYQTNSNGLTIKEVKIRQEKFGLNKFDEKEKQSPIVKFLMQFKEALTILLIIAAIISFIIGDTLDSIVIFCVVLLNAIVGFKQEYKAEKAMEKLKDIVVKTAVVIRDGEKEEIDSKNLTIGDIVIIEEGDKVPADLILIESSDLRIDESLLTGESRPVSKNTDYNTDDEKILDILNNNNINSKELSDKIAYMDSNVISGRGIGVVYAIGMNTSIGKIASFIQEDSEETPLQNKVDKLGKTLGLFAIVVCILVFIIEYFEGLSLVDNFMTAVSLAVAAVPEGLPAVLTLTLALGMQKMAKSNGIIRRLLAVETLGSCNVICTDKTGTLTLNRMSVKKSEIYSNMGYNVGYLCNNSTIKNGDIIGDPTDGAILEFAQDKINFEYIKNNKRIKEIPLTSSRKRMSIIYSTEDEYINNNLKQIRKLENGDLSTDKEKIVSYTKGAPEIILSKSKYIDDNGTIKPIDKDLHEDINSKIEEMTNSALRVIGLGYKILNKNHDDLDEYKNLNDEEFEDDLIFCGIVGMIDPPKDKTKESIDRCKDAGIDVVMITGDHKDTAKAVAEELGILTNGKIVTGEELDRLSDEEYSKICEDIQVYARVYPEQKVRIVETLKSKGNIVSMTGDGVNDAPALKKASIGVAMGGGTDVAKESSDMILQNDDFSTIVKAIEEGRKIFDNIKRFVKFQVSTNIGAILTIVGASIINIPLPFNPIQILWINIIMDGPPAQSLGNEGPEKNLMHRKPENGEILEKKDFLRIIVFGITMAIGTLGLFIYELNTNQNLGIKQCKTKAMTIAFTVFVIYQLFSAYCNKSNSNDKNKAFTLAVIISFILQLAVIYIAPLQTIFRTTGISIIDWMLIFAVAFTIFIVEYILRKTIFKE